MIETRTDDQQSPCAEEGIRRHYKWLKPFQTPTIEGTVFRVLEDTISDWNSDGARRSGTVRTGIRRHYKWLKLDLRQSERYLIVRIRRHYKWLKQICVRILYNKYMY